jgi:hypothetical protein
MVLLLVFESAVSETQTGRDREDEKQVPQDSTACAKSYERTSSGCPLSRVPSIAGTTSQRASLLNVFGAPRIR